MSRDGAEEGTARWRRAARAFLLPRPTRWLALRAALVAAAAFLVFRFVARPALVVGESMEPTYSERGFNFVLHRAARSDWPARGAVVVLRWAGERKELLKRVVAFEGETVEWRDGVCLVDGVPLDEPYVKRPCDWTRWPLTVSPGCVYVVGDNRSMPMENHACGEIDRSRIVGRPLW